MSRVILTVQGREKKYFNSTISAGPPLESPNNKYFANYLSGSTLQTNMIETASNQYSGSDSVFFGRGGVTCPSEFYLRQFNLNNIFEQTPECLIYDPCDIIDVCW